MAISKDCFEFEGFRAKVKVTVAISRKNVIVSAFIYELILT